MKLLLNYVLSKYMCEVCTGKYLPEVFVQTEQRRSEICKEKRRKLLSRTDQAIYYVASS